MPPAPDLPHIAPLRMKRQFHAKPASLMRIPR
jgi:hypothetical protein